MLAGKKTKYTEKILFHCQCVHQKFHIHWPQTEPGPPHSEVSMYMVHLHTIFMCLVHMLLKAKESFLFCICFQWHNVHNDS